MPILVLIKTNDGRILLLKADVIRIIEIKLVLTLYVNWGPSVTNNFKREAKQVYDNKRTGNERRYKTALFNKKLNKLILE